ncbi:hypothetical protein BU14_0407s0019 [Porphyra umbilicalis]|uniref:Coenzyme Q-binding protein COQ10 START domain-containing protein n=1 Tax=Porphyra umbilicalis TaxID=2786 RepID=A0A1X6NW24_PORUM|nr:hypothetical protein BU14_0407s0019 [Porphyra umbilicalis]|eukprot:OSX72755.1 hypothetical protein BU14_0407s0019 [Porphyra umbilicalis]
MAPAFVPVAGALGGGAAVRPRLAAAAGRRAAGRPAAPPHGRRCRPPPSPRMTWIEKSATVTVEAPRDFCYTIFSDLEAQPKWSPWLKSVQVDPVDPDLSRWSLASRGVEVSWQARNTSVIRPEVIAWESLDGLPNKGAVTFVDAAAAPALSPPPSAAAAATAAGRAQRPVTEVTLAISFDVPAFIAAVLKSDAVGQYVEQTLLADLKRYRAVVLKEVRAVARAKAAA